MISIYALINPINDKVFYIGATSQPKTRLQGHTSSKNSSVKKNEMIRVLDAFGMKPEMIILDECHEEESQFWEEFYIELYLSFGYDLLQKRKSNFYQPKAFIYEPPMFNRELGDKIDTFTLSGCFRGIDIRLTLTQPTHVLSFTKIKDRLYELYESRINDIKSYELKRTA